MKPSVQKSLIWAVILSESSHVFCCVFPTIFSLLSLLAGLGLVTAMPAFMVRMHETLHAWELPMILASASVLALGWAATLYSDRIDCHHTGCAHGACTPKKSKAHLVLKIATALFVFNVLIYAGVHKSAWFSAKIAADRHHGEETDGHVGHDHP